LQAGFLAGPQRPAQIIPPGAKELGDLMSRLRRARRADAISRRSPMILQQPDFWDNEALKEIIAYRGHAQAGVGQHQFSRVLGLNLMRNSINAQIFFLRTQGLFWPSPPRMVRRTSRCSTM